jgi:hypothetical protein
MWSWLRRIMNLLERLMQLEAHYSEYGWKTYELTWKLPQIELATMWNRLMKKNNLKSRNIRTQRVPCGFLKSNAWDIYNILKQFNWTLRFFRFLVHPLLSSPVSLSYQFANFEYFSIKEWPDQTIHAFIWSKSHSNPCENSGSADYLKALSKNPLKHIHHIVYKYGKDAV